MGMHTYKKLFVIIALCVTMAQPVHAVTQAELLAQIDALLKIVLSLQEQVRALSSNTTQPPPSIDLSNPSSTGITSFFRPSDYDICVTPPTRTLELGVEGTDVLALQEFLRGSADYTGDLGGYFGQLTQAAVKRFQSAQGIVSNGNAESTGYGVVGPKTRAAIAAFCAQPPVDEPQQPTISVQPSTPTHTQSTQNPSCPIVPALAENFCGAGFAAKAIYAIDGCQTGWMCAAAVVTPSSSTSPNTTECTAVYTPVCGRINPTDAPITFSNRCYMENARAQFISDGICENYTANTTPVITSISGPTELSLNQTGTWTINASDADGDALQYKIIWGDEQNSSIGNITNLANVDAFTSAKTFTHFYSLSGTYTVRAQVKDVRGATTEKTHTVRIGGGSGKCYSNITLYPEGSVRTCITKDGGGGTMCAPNNFVYVCRTNEWVLEQTSN